MKAEATASPGSCFAQVSEGGFLVLHSPEAHTLLDGVREFLRTRLEPLATGELPDWIDFQVQVADALEAAHCELREGQPQDRDLAVSATLLLCRGQNYQLAHLGAGRPLLFSRRFLHPLTRAHTVAFDLFEKGEIKASELPAHPASGDLTRGLGIPLGDSMMATSAAFRRGQVHPGDQLLVPAGDLMAHLQEEHLLEFLEGEEGAEATARGISERSRDEGARYPACLLLRLEEGHRIAVGWHGAGGEPPAPEVAPPSPPGPTSPSVSAADPEVEPIAQATAPSAPESIPEAVSEDASEATEAAQPSTQDLLDEAPAPPPFPLALQDPPSDPPAPPSREKTTQELLEEAPERPPLPPNLGALIAAKEAEEAQDAAGVETSPTSEAPGPPSPPAPREGEADSGEGSPAPEAPPAPLPRRKESTTNPRISQIRHRYPTPEDQRGERWVAIDQESWLDSTISVGLVLLGALAALSGLFWWSIVKA